MSGPQKRRRYQLTEEGRSSLRAAARRTKPWRSTRGPKTAKGKRRSSRNALKCGEAAAEVRAAYREINGLLREIRASCGRNSEEILEAANVSELQTWWARIEQEQAGLQ